MQPPSAPGARGALLLLLPSLVVVLFGVATPAVEMSINQGDVGLYLSKVQALAAGQVPYRDFPIEYPPLALVSMVVPYLLALPLGPPTIDTYRWTFLAWEAALLAGLALVLVRLAARLGIGDPVRTIGIRLTLLSAGAALVLAWRFDLLPALLAALGLWAALANRPGAAGVALGLGVATKLFPVVLAPALAARWLLPLDAPRVVRFGAAVAAATAVAWAPFALAAGPSAFQAVEVTAARGLNIESVAAGLVILQGLLAGTPVGTYAPFASVEVLGPAASAWLATLPILMLIGFGVLGWLGLGRIRDDVARDGAVAPATIVELALGSMLVLLVTSKVFSIQYVVWLLPLAVLLSGRRLWLAVAIFGLTMPIHPVLYGLLVRQEAIPIVLLNIRNGLVVALLASVLFELRAPRPGRGPGPAVERVP